MSLDFASLRQTFRDDGVVVVRGALDGDALQALRTAYEWSLAHPGPRASRIAQTGEAIFYNDLDNPDCLTGYREVLLSFDLPDLVAAVWGAPDVWFMYEQVFLKEGGESRRTPWHQDSSYLAVGGHHLAVAWITFDAVSKEDALEFVRGSHRGTLYNGSRFEFGDDTAPLFAGETLPGCRISNEAGRISTSFPMPSNPATWCCSTPRCCMAALPPIPGSAAAP